jgi:hypothetical protein
MLEFIAVFTFLFIGGAFVGKDEGQVWEGFKAIGGLIVIVFIIVAFIAIDG